VIESKEAIDDPIRSDFCFLDVISLAMFSFESKLEESL
jgi:hypothetical protein